MNNFSERICDVFKEYGYTQYKMSKFEEYDLYVKNKDFLVSDNIITFTDMTGKLMALKPDVTLSIIKNSDDDKDSVKKVFYDENVYRVTKGATSYKEIKQVGLECFGDVDDYCLLEVLMLATKTLSAISSEYRLDISNISILTEILDNLDISAKVSNEVLALLGQKNLHELQSLLSKNNVDEKSIELLSNLTKLYGPVDKVMPQLKEYLPESEGVKQLEKILFALGDKNVEIDFSVAPDVHYYNGLVFSGFVNGVADSVLSGGQYDNLMTRLKRKSKAVGFALYVNMLEELLYKTPLYDVDVVLLYDDNTDINALLKKVEEIKKTGKTVLCTKTEPKEINAREVIKYA